jgi:pimeloyl-ACP methyl ester carboxylesterase
VESRVRATLALCFADPARVPRERYDDAVAEARRRSGLGYDAHALVQSLRGLIATYLTRGQDTPWQLAARVQAPTLLVYGLKDKLVDPRSSARAMRTFPDPRLVCIPDSGHVAQMEHPEIVAKAVRELLDRWAASASLR